MDVYIAGKRVRVTPKDAIGHGGEADIYTLGQGVALKLFKPPEHPDFAARPEQQVAAAQRLTTLQTKLPAFPAGLPGRIVTPLELATNRGGTKVLGYTMPLVQEAEVLWRYGDKAFRQQGIGAAMVVDIFRDLHATVTALHAADIIIGDFNDLNVLVRDTEAYVIDADSFQFGAFPCQVYTEHVIDPMLCDPHATRPVQQQPYTDMSDWYAFTVMLFRSLLLLHPYGGVHKPPRPSQRLPHSARPLHRITVFDPHVQYPKPAYRYDILPDALLQYFHHVLTRDVRGVFPRALLDTLTWTTCAQCGLEHTRPDCPVCHGTALPVVYSVVNVQGGVTAKTVVDAPGPILCATVADGALRLLIRTDAGVVREDQHLVLAGQLHPHMHLRLLPNTTLVGQGHQLAIVPHAAPPTCLEVETCHGTPVFDSNSATYFWVQHGQLMRAGAFGPERIGDVLSGQTRIWVGPTLGFGFYRAGDLCVAFVFDPCGAGLNDSIRLPAMRGHVMDVTCQIARDRCWLIWRTKARERVLKHAAVIRADGTVEATLSTAGDTTSWLQAASGALAVDAMLLAPTDEGITRVDIRQGQLVPTKTFSHTEPFVDAASRLLPGSGGIYVVRDRTVQLLTLS